MKKLLCLLCSVALLVCFVGCEDATVYPRELSITSVTAKNGTETINDVASYEDDVVTLTQLPQGATATIKASISNKSNLTSKYRLKIRNVTQPDDFVNLAFADEDNNYKLNYYTDYFSSDQTDSEYTLTVANVGTQPVTTSFKLTLDTTQNVTYNADAIVVEDSADLLLWAKYADSYSIDGLTLTLTKDVDMQGVTWPVVNLRNVENFTIDGQNHKISNLIIATHLTEGYGAGFINSIGGSVNVKNITFDKCYSSIGGDSYHGNIVGIIFGYVYGDATFDNVSVTNSTVDGYGKVGAFVGMGASSNVHVTFNNCKSTGNTLKGVYNVGGLAGNIFRDGDNVDNTVINNCTVNNTWEKDESEEYTQLDTVVTDDNSTAPTCLGNGYAIQGTYWEHGGYYYGAYGKYYVSYGNATHDCKLQGTTLLLADSEVTVDEVTPAPHD